MPWSDWQTYGNKSWDVIEFSRRVGQLTNGFIDTFADSDVAAYLETLRATANAFTDGADPTPFTFTHGALQLQAAYDVLTQKDNATSLQSVATVLMRQGQAYYDGSFFDGATDDFPPLLAGLTFGVDYDYIPDTSDFVEYESDVTPFVGWADKTVTFYVYSVGFHEETTAGSGSVTTLPVPNFDLNLFTSTPPMTLDWPAWAPGTLLDTITLTGLDSSDPTDPAQQYVETVPFSAITDEAFVVSLQTDFQNATPFPLANLTMPGNDPGFDNQIREGMRVRVGPGGGDFDASNGFGAVQVIYTLPRFRYWIPDNIYTVGGHWSDPNGVVVKRLKDDGVTWIPIVDGLAPQLR